MRWLVAGTLVCASLLAWGGCATVEPWEREHLADPSMTAAPGANTMDARQEAKVLESTTSGGMPGDSPGGGCGCSQ